MKLKALLIIVVGVLAIISLSRSLWGKYRRVGRLEDLQQEVESLESEYQELKQEREEVGSEEFLEKEARDKLQMVKPGEKIVILPENVLEGVVDEESRSREVISLESSWKRWYELFFE